MRNAINKPQSMIQIIFMLCLLLLLSGVFSACQISNNESATQTTPVKSAIPGESTVLPQPEATRQSSTETAANLPGQTEENILADMIFPIPSTSAVINAENADLVRPLARFGEGTIVKAFWSLDEQRLLLVTTIGSYLLDRSADNEPRYISAHTMLRQAVISTEETWLYMLSFEGPATIYRWDTGEIVRELSGIDGEPLAVSPDGRFLATESGLWVTSSLQQIATFDPPANNVVFSNDSTRMIVDQQIWSTDNGQARMLNQLDYDRGSMEFGSDFKIGILAVDSGYEIWDLQAGQQVSLLPDDNARAHSNFLVDQDSLIVAVEPSEINALRISDGSIAYSLTDFDNKLDLLSPSPSGQLMLGGFRDGSVVIWRAEDGGEMERWRYFIPSWQETVFSAVQNRVAVRSINEDIYVFNLTDNHLENYLPRPADKGLDLARRGLIFSADGTQLAFAEGKEVLLWDIANNALTRKFPCQSEVQSLAFTPDGSMFACAGVLSLEVWQLQSGVLLQSFPNLEYSGGVYDIDFSRDGRFLAAGGMDGQEVVVLQTSNWSEVARLTSPILGFIRDIAFSPTEDLLAIGEDIIKIYRIPDGELINNFHIEDRVTSLTFNPGGQLLVAGTDDGDVIIYELDGTLRGSFQTHSRTVLSLAFEPAGQVFYSTSADRTSQAWGIVNDLLTAPIPEYLLGHEFKVNQAKFSPDQSLLATLGTTDLLVWETKTWTQVRKFAFEGNERYIIGDFSSDNDLITLIQPNNSFASFYQISTNMIRPVAEPGVFATAFSPDGTYLAVSYLNENRIQILRVADGAEVNQFPITAYGLSYSPDEQYLGVVENIIPFKVSLIQLENGQVAWSYQDPEDSTRDTYYLPTMVFSPDGKLVAYGRDVARVSDGMIISRIENAKALYPIGFSPESNRIAIVIDSSVQLIDIQSQTILQTIDDCVKLDDLFNVLSATIAQDWSLIACNAINKVALIPLER